MTSENGTCPVAGGELHVQRTGNGPPLLLIAGGLGSADGYRVLAKRLSSDYTVLSYDRRGHFRSTDRTDGPIPVERHAEDAHAVLGHFGFEAAAVFGTSAGGQIGLALATKFPDAVTTLVAHEPPAVRLLPDADEWLAFGAEHVELSRSGDRMGAFAQFAGSLAGAGLPDLKAVRLPNEREWAFLFDREVLEFYGYLPDIQSLRGSPVDITLAAGEESRGYFHYTPAKILALELGLPFVEVPGAHLAPQRNPGPFADALKELLEPGIG